MKGLFLLVIITLSLLIPQSIKASHFMGGEITWECVNTGTDAGKYVFYLKVYRECGGITFGNTQTIKSNSPDTSIAMTLVSGYPKDISPTCYLTSGNVITCAGAESSGNDNTGAVAEYLYVSAPIVLSGVPPSTGWIFSWTNVNRNPSSNLFNGQNQGWTLRAKMYPYNNTDASICYDNSPQFSSIAKSILAAGYPSSFNHYVCDNDLDSLSFEWGEPLVTLGNPVTYNQGYNYINPLPSASVNPLNIGATINHQTGVVSYKSFTTGAYVTCIKVSSYRENHLVSETWREIQIVLLAGGSNLPPIVNPTFNGGTTFSDTVYSGDTVNCLVNGQDIQFLPNGTPQTMYLTAKGQQFGSYIPAYDTILATYDIFSGCPKLPCATLTPAPSDDIPISAVFGIQTSLHWETNNNHLNIKSNGVLSPKTHYFYFELRDNYCPAPAYNSFTLEIKVMPSKPSLITEIKSINTLQNGDIKLNWTPVIDSNNTFISYNILVADSVDGEYILLDSNNNINNNSYTYSPVQNSTNKYYKIKTYQSNYNNINYATSPNPFSNIALNTTYNGNCITNLTWNNTTENNTYFKIKRKDNGLWTLINTTSLQSYTDTSDDISSEYMIETQEVLTNDSLGNTFFTMSTSNIKHEQTPLNIGADTTLCKDGSLLLNITNSFDSYLWYNGISNNWLLIHASDLTIGDNNIWLKANMNYGCEITDTLVLTIEDCNTSINENNDKLSFEIFPNPSSGKFTLDIKSMETQDLLIEVISIDGKIIYSKNTKISSNETSINMDISDQAAGSYIIRISNENYKSQKAIKLI